jgi:exopolyphosphatase/guanosine-5'-triphosphate,3'-diphosphate pyrophosphatase
MSETSPPARQRRTRGSRRARNRPRRVYAALDLGTNNCRLLIAAPQAPRAAEPGPNFRVVDGYSEIVRLGEGLAATGRLSDAAMTRTLGALKVCAEKIGAWPIEAGRYIATQACRGSENGRAFLDRVTSETGLEFHVISPREEAELAVLGCAGLIDPRAEAALIVDIGGGSTEISWVKGGRERGAIMSWASLPYGVVTLADQWGERMEEQDGYEAVVAEVRKALTGFDCASVRDAFTRGAAHYVGTSGTVTSLAGVRLGLARYQRSKVDGVWMSVEETRSTIAELRAQTRDERARNPCIGRERADLVTPGAAILEAIFDTWGAERIRVADRGLREGVLSTLMAEAAARRGA